MGRITAPFEEKALPKCKLQPNPMHCMVHTTSSAKIWKAEDLLEATFVPLPHVEDQPAQWRSLDLHQLNHWLSCLGCPVYGFQAAGRGLGYCRGLQPLPTELPAPPSKLPPPGSVLPSSTPATPSAKLTCPGNRSTGFSPTGMAQVFTPTFLIHESSQTCSTAF